MEATSVGNRGVTIICNVRAVEFICIKFNFILGSMNTLKTQSIFISGPISPVFIGEIIAGYSSKTGIGAHSIFLGQVRNDKIDGKTVKAIEYSAYVEMAEDKIMDIRESAFAKFDLTCMHIHHSLGKVNAGEICLFVFTSSKHRKEAMEACTYIVNRVKSDVPVWGKEIFEDDTHSWKQNN
jgi:molybdopterin synthase catalytic subunit